MKKIKRSIDYMPKKSKVYQVSDTEFKEIVS